MSDQPVIRVFRCRPLRLAFDEILRGVMLPELARRPGVTAVYAGRQGPDEIGTRVVVSIWRSRAEMTADMGADIEESSFHPEYLPETEGRVVEVMPLELALLFSDTTSAAILQFAQGRVREGGMEAYLDEVREGTRRDVAAGTGPAALYVGRPKDDTFMTLSIWRAWAEIEAATGADLHRPISTQRADGLVDFEASHYSRIL